MDPADLLYARLALARRWISPEVYEETLARVERLQALGVRKTVEDVLREGAHIEEGRLRVLRRLLNPHTQQARVGDYLLVRQIGTGGTGLVFEGCHRRIGRRVALKILFPRLEKQEGFAERFLREATVLARINHPNVVHAYDAGQDGDFYYIATEIVEGHDLRKILNDVGPLSLVDFQEIAIAMSRGLQAIHNAGLLHRDIKPANVLVSSDRANRTVKLVDFGLVFGDEGGLRTTSSESGLVIGTPEYMSPEHIRGDPLPDRRSDLYSLGATFYHMLTGKVPFKRASPHEILRAHLEERPESLNRLRNEVPAVIVALVEGLLSRDRNGRPDSAEEVARTLESVKLSAPVETRPTRREASSDRRRWVYRPLAWSACVAAVFLLGLGLGLLRTLPENRDAANETTSEAGPGAPSVDIRDDSPDAADDAVLPDSKQPALAMSEIDAGRVALTPQELEAQRQRWSEARRDLSDAVERIRSLDWVERMPLSGTFARLWNPADEADLEHERDTVVDGLQVPMEIADWIVDSSHAIRDRFRARMAEVEQDRSIRALLNRRDRPVVRRVWVEDTLAGLTFVDVEEDQRYELDDAHALMALEWGGFHRVSNDALQHAIGFLIGAGESRVASLLVSELGVTLPRQAERVLGEMEVGEIPGSGGQSVVETYFGSILETTRLRRKGRLGLENSQWADASEAYRRLIELTEVPESLIGESENWEVRLDRSLSLHWLTSKLFHGRANAVDAFHSKRLRIEYGWEAENELRDFRTRRGAWVLRYGELAKTAPETEFLDTIAFFRLPVRLEIRWSLPESERNQGTRVSLAAFFDTIGLGVGGPEADLQIIGLGSAEDKHFASGDPTADSGSLTVEWTSDRIAARTASGNRIDTTHPLPVPSFGRVGLRVHSGAVIDSLRVEGEVHPVWARERKAFSERHER